MAFRPNKFWWIGVSQLCLQMQTCAQCLGYNINKKCCKNVGWKEKFALKVCLRNQPLESDILPELLMPMRVSFLNAERVNGSVSCIDQSVRFSSFHNVLINCSTILIGNVKLPAQLSHKTYSQSKNLFRKYFKLITLGYFYKYPVLPQKNSAFQG